MKLTTFKLSSKRLVPLVILIINLFFICSCDIQKKRYSPGYTVSWNKKYKNNHIPTTLHAENTIDSTQLDTPTPAIKHQYEKSEVITCLKYEPAKILTNEVIIEQSDFASNSNQINNYPLKIESKSEFGRHEYKAKPEIKRIDRVKRTNAYVSEKSQKTNLLALFALIFSLLFLLLFIPTIISLVIGFIALIQIRNNPKKYSHSSKRMAISALTIDLLLLLIVLSIFFSFLFSVIVFFTLLLIMIFILASSPNRMDKKTDSQPIEDTNPKKERDYSNLKRFWIKHRLFALFLVMFSAFLFIPIGM